MLCKKFKGSYRDGEVCCDKACRFERPNITDCEFPCTYAFMHGYTKKDFKLKCEYYKNNEIWSWSETAEDDWLHGIFGSREEAIEDALGNIEEIKSYLETDTPTIYVGRCEYVPLPTSVDSESILMDLDEMYCDETGCEDYIYEGVTDEQTQWLEDKLSDLMVEFHEKIGLKPGWFRVVEQEEVDLSEYEKVK